MAGIVGCNFHLELSPDWRCASHTVTALEFRPSRSPSGAVTPIAKKIRRPARSKNVMGNSSPLELAGFITHGPADPRTALAFRKALPQARPYLRGRISLTQSEGLS